VNQYTSGVYSCFKSFGLCRQASEFILNRSRPVATCVVPLVEKYGAQSFVVPYPGNGALGFF
jgi:hypothetical protein